MDVPGHTPWSRHEHIKVAVAAWASRVVALLEMEGPSHTATSAVRPPHTHTNRYRLATPHGTRLVISDNRPEEAPIGLLWQGLAALRRQLTRDRRWHPPELDGRQEQRHQLPGSGSWWGISGISSNG